MRSENSLLSDQASYTNLVHIVGTWKWQESSSGTLKERTQRILYLAKISSKEKNKSETKPFPKETKTERNSLSA